MAVNDDIYDDQHQDCELLSLSLASKTSLGKRPRQLDYMALHDDHRANLVNIGDHEAQGRTMFTGPADQKRRHIDPNELPKNILMCISGVYVVVFRAMKFRSGLCEPQVQLSKGTQTDNGPVIKRIFDNPAKDTKWDLEQLKPQDEKFDGQ
ncbi:PREDICTED: TMV resistance [Prunus dulcis]|uniref:PREDICTED: TMV resistance n=1 Tax=Prunus dulcis TaxID=3755 RepID=A0A5E4FL85_PRUDU|nr:PREDICTED: TMV resistance [Prunus dulcis]